MTVDGVSSDPNLTLNCMLPLRCRFFPAALCLLLASVMFPRLSAQESEAELFFESKVRPILANNCYTCHTGAQSGGLRLDSREAIVEWRQVGPRHHTG